MESITHIAHTKQIAPIAPIAHTAAPARRTLPAFGWWVFGLFGLAGCANPPAWAPTPPKLPAHWEAPPASGAATEARATARAIDIPPDADWWRGLGGEELLGLIVQAEAQNRDIAAAAARLRQAQASTRSAAAVLRPEVSANLDAGREDRLGGRAAVDGDIFEAGLSARYEADVWGGGRAGRDAARATAQASAYERDAVRLSVSASAASHWIQAVALKERAAIAQQNLRSAEHLLALVRSQVAAGAATPLDLARQQALVADQRRGLAAVRQQGDEARTALAILLGQAGRPALRTDSLDALQAPAIGAGVPSDLLTRRPDIAQAEAGLRAASADVAAARAAMLPRLTLTAAIGAESERWRTVLDNPLYSLAAGLSAPIFNAGKLRAGHERAQARREELLADYRQAIVAAFGDVEAALAMVSGVDAQLTAQADQLAQAQEALRLAESRHRAGAETQLALIDAQRTLYAARDDAVQLRAQRLQAAVQLYRALGGGWRRATRPTSGETS